MIFLPLEEKERREKEERRKTNEEISTGRGASIELTNSGKRKFDAERELISRLIKLKGR